MEEKARNQLQAGAFTEKERQDIQTAVEKKYVEVAQSADGLFKYVTGRAGAEQLGYDSSQLKTLPDNVLASFCGVGNPLAVGTVDKGWAILDIGCGAGLDLIMARNQTGQDGRVCGIDATPEMVEKARANLKATGCEDVEVKLVESVTIPYEDATFDLVISNGVINLSSQKAELFSEIFRVLKPGGRLWIADILLAKPLPPQMAANLEAWAQ